MPAGDAGGAGGIGKTRLALEVGATRGERHRDGVVLVSFAGTSPARPEEAADLVVTNLAAALGVSLAVPRDPREVLAEALAGRELLLVLDNLEQLRDAAGVLAELLGRAPGVQVLGTSRRRLGLGVEWLVEVPGLPYPPLRADAEAGGYPAVQLFEDRARLLRPGFRPAADLAAVGRVCRLVAGVPLAIELAARWVRSASPAAIADRLAAGGELLETTAPDVEPRHRSMATVIDWSWELLGDGERQALRRLSVLRGGFDLDAAAAVAGAGLPLLAGLVDQSLVQVGEDGRYGMHELLRQYAGQRLAADPAEEAAARRRHAAYFSGLLPDPDQPLPGGGAAQLDADVENLRSATDWLVEHGDPAELDRHLTRLWQLYRRRGWFRQAQAALGAALRRREVPVAERAHWHRLLAEAHVQLGEMRQARDHFEQTLALLGSPLPTSGLGWSDMLVSQALQRPLRRLRPGGPAERSEARRRRAAEPAAVCWQLQEACWMLEDQAPLIPLAVWALNLSERAERPDLLMMNQAGLGNSLTAAGLHRLARSYVRDAVAAAGRTSDPVAVSWTYIVASLHWLAVGDWAAVDAGLPRALEVGTGARLHRAVDQVVLLAGIGRYLTGRFEEAAAMAADARAAARDRRDPMAQLWGVLVLAESRLRSDPANPAVAGALAEGEALLGGGIPHDRRRSPPRGHGPLAPGRRPGGGRLAVDPGRGRAGRPGALVPPLHHRGPRRHPRGLPGPAGRRRGAGRGAGRAAGDGGRRPAPPAPLRPRVPHGPSPGAALARLVAGARRPPAPGAPVLGPGRAGGRAPGDALGGGQRTTRARPPPRPGRARPGRAGPGRPPGPGRRRVRGHGLPGADAALAGQRAG